MRPVPPRRISSCSPPAAAVSHAASATERSATRSRTGERGARPDTRKPARILRALREANPRRRSGRRPLRSFLRRGRPGRLGSSVVLQWNTSRPRRLWLSGRHRGADLRHLQGRPDRLAPIEYHQPRGYGSSPRMLRSAAEERSRLTARRPLPEAAGVDAAADPKERCAGRSCRPCASEFGRRAHPRCRRGQADRRTRVAHPCEGDFLRVSPRVAVSASPRARAGRTAYSAPCVAHSAPPSRASRS